ncbi:hypothetical protein [Moraxella catarrhalis]|uniref:DUF6414 family protein n=1 Tax=Moraxella catarrhalis TaxID=480 RepID=UPI000E051CA4|nr:hypothetical protein [Moraxella catarrhalis]STY79417.1 Uncharacterised protein [Moraxella catarrhalis]
MAQELPNTELLFDFLYVDTYRIKSYYAQLTGRGALSLLKMSDNTSTTQLKEATLGVPTVGGGKLSFNALTNQLSEHSYDPMPSMPSDVINRLDELGFIERDLTVDNLGNLVLLSGKLGISDISLLKDVSDALLKQLAEEKSSLETNPKKRKQVYEQEIKANKHIFDFLKQIPYSLEARLILGDDEVWMTLNRDEIIGSAYEINFKHGDFLSGEYYVLGVLDATPNDDYQSPIIQTQFKLAMTTMVQDLKNLLGRPSTCYGITPVAIFRVIRANKQDA